MQEWGMDSDHMLHDVAPTTHHHPYVNERR